MAKHKIGWLPGDGIGIEVCAAARVVLDRLGLDAEYTRGRHRLGVLAPGGRRLPAADDRPAQERGCGHVRRHHLQTGQGRRSRVGSRAAGQGSGVPVAHRAHAPAVRPLRLPAALQGLPRQSLQLQRGHRSGGVPGEHRGPLRGRRVQPGAPELADTSESSPRASLPSRSCPATSTPSPARSTRGKVRSASSGPPSSSPASMGARR